MLDIHTAVNTENSILYLKPCFIGWASRVKFPISVGISVFAPISRRNLGSTQPPVPWVPRESLVEGKAEYLSISGAGDGNEWS